MTTAPPGVNARLTPASPTEHGDVLSLLRFPILDALRNPSPTLERIARMIRFDAYVAPDPHDNLRDGIDFAHALIGDPDFPRTVHPLLVQWIEDANALLAAGRPDDAVKVAEMAAKAKAEHAARPTAWERLDLDVFDSAAE